jgi:hypothetical protein
MYQTFRESMTLPGAPNTLQQGYAVVSADRKPTLIIGSDVFHFASELDIGEVRGYAPSKPKLPSNTKSSRLVREFADVISRQKKPTENTDAYNDFLRGREPHREGTERMIPENDSP